jgi:hypothetical protein
MGQQQLEWFQITNVISSNATVDFCHSIDLSLLPWKTKQVMIKVVDDITLVFHLAGQLTSSQSFYQVANQNTLQIKDSKKIFLYESEIRLEQEETSFYNVSSSTRSCVRYNATWTYDKCMHDFAIQRIGKKNAILSKLLKPDGSRVEEGVESSILQDIYSVLLSRGAKENCKQDCRSLKATMKAEANTSAPSTIIPILEEKKVPFPLPPISVAVNISIPELSKINEVKVLYQITITVCFYPCEKKILFILLLIKKNQ